MKKLTIVALVVVLVVSCLVFTGCGKKEDKKNDQYEIALVTDVGNIDDKSFNQGTWEGVEAYAKEHNIFCKCNTMKSRLWLIKVRRNNPLNRLLSLKSG